MVVRDDGEIPRGEAVTAPQGARCAAREMSRAIGPDSDIDDTTRSNAASPGQPTDRSQRSAVPQPPVETEVGNYVIEELIGAGGGGSVYSARDRATDRRVAIKILRQELISVPSMLARFVREATAINTIGHPNIVSIYEFGHLGESRPYYVMELLDGMDLRKLLQLRGRFSAAETLALIEQIGDAVQAAHDAGFIHRDIKASNVFVTDEGGERKVKLLDFGIAKLLQNESTETGLTAPGTRLGTAHYMAPEQIRCESVDTRADVYALGVLAYQLLTGEYPFQADDPHNVALLHLQSPAPRPSASAPVSPALDAVVLRCLEKQPDQRFQFVTEFLEAFRAAQLSDTGNAVEAGSSGFALGIHFEVLLADPESDSDVFETAGSLLDVAEQCLKERGFVFPLRTSNALLGARIADDRRESSDPSELSAALLHELEVELSQRADPHPGARIAVSFDSGAVRYRRTPTGDEIVGGKLLDEVHLWSDRHWL